MTGTDLGATPSRLVVSGVLRLDNVVDDFTVEAGAEVQAESLELLAGTTNVVVTGAGSLLEITGNQPSILGDPFVLGDDFVSMTISSGGEVRFTDPASQLTLSAGFDSRSAITVESGSRLEAALIEINDDDATSIRLDDGTVAASDEIVIDRFNSHLISVGTDTVEGDLRLLGGSAQITSGGSPASLQVTGDLTLAGGTVTLGGAGTQLDLLGDLVQDAGQIELASVHDAQVGGSYLQNGGTLLLKFPDPAVDGTIQVVGPVEVRGTIDAEANFPPLGTRYRPIDSATSMLFAGTVTASGLAAGHSLAAEVVGSDLELVVTLPEPGRRAGGFAALAVLLGIRAMRRSGRA